MIKVSLRQQFSYEEVLNIQISEFERRIKLRKNNFLLPEDVVFFVEHRPVYTIGLHGDISHLLKSPDDLHNDNIEFAKIGRGGDITYHGPGQLTVYPIIDLQRLKLGVKEYVSILEEAVILTIESYGIKGERIEGKTGVWVGKGTLNERKICAIGIKCSRFVSMHGLALNISADLVPFSGIVPCGLPNEVTSISKEVGYEVSLDEVESKLWHSLKTLLQPHIPSQGNS